MIVDKQNNITVITQEKLAFQQFLTQFLTSYDTVQENHLIINLLSLSLLDVNDLVEFLDISRQHRSKKKSFVIVMSKVDFDNVHDELIVSPTLKEAYDIIEMEEIERDLDF